MCGLALSLMLAMADPFTISDTSLWLSWSTAIFSQRSRSFEPGIRHNIVSALGKEVEGVQRVRKA